MKSKEDLQQDYENYLDYVRCGRYGFTYEELDSHSIEELETLANFGWSDEAAEELYEIFIRRRKRKMNMQFVFNQENIHAIVQIDKQLKDCCRQLKQETETVFNQMLEQKRENFSIEGSIKIRANSELLDCAFSVLDENLLYFSLNPRNDIDSINLVPIFNLDRNYAAKVLSYNTQKAMIVYNALEDCHIGYAFYKLYRESCLSLQDILEIVIINGEIKPCYYIKQIP